MKAVLEEDVQQIVIDFVREKKNAEKIFVSSVEQKDGVWIIHGTCPIDLEGHPWTERFEVIIDLKGKVKSTYFSLL